MSASWTARILVQSDGLSHERLRDLGLSPRGLEPFLIDGEIHGMTGDGTGSVAFTNVENALLWLSTTDGLVPFRVPDTDEELDLSIHRRRGILSLEMESLPDVPIYDVLAISVAASSFQRAGEAVWAAVLELLSNAFTLLPMEFVYGMHEDALEAEWRYLCVHQRVSEGRLPPFIPWMAGAPVGSPIASELHSAAKNVGGRLDSLNDVLVLKLSERPWDRPVETVLHASQAWREANGDLTC